MPKGVNADGTPRVKSAWNIAVGNQLDKGLPFKQAVAEAKKTYKKGGKVSTAKPRKPKKKTAKK